MEMIELLPGKRIKCKCGGKVFRVQLLGPAHYKLYCQKCRKEVMTIRETPEEFEKSKGALDG